MNIHNGTRANLAKAEKEYQYFPIFQKNLDAHFSNAAFYRRLCLGSSILQKDQKVGVSRVSIGMTQ
jgi:hypothetical protein